MRWISLNILLKLQLRSRFNLFRIVPNPISVRPSRFMTFKILLRFIMIAIVGTGGSVIWARFRPRRRGSTVSVTIVFIDRFVRSVGLVWTICHFMLVRMLIRIFFRGSWWRSVTVRNSLVLMMPVRVTSLLVSWRRTMRPTITITVRTSWIRPVSNRWVWRCCRYGRRLCFIRCISCC